MKYYILVTQKEWKELQKPINEIPFDHSNSFLKKSLVDYAKLKPVRYQYSNHIDEIVQYCVKNQNECKNLYPVLEKLCLYYGRNTYNKDDIKLAKALKEALISEQAILIEKPVDTGSGMLAPQNNFLISSSNKIPRRLTAEEERDYYSYLNEDDEENYIEITIKDLPNQPFTIFDSASQKLLKEGALDNNGYAYVNLPTNSKHVEIAFTKTKELRPWYYDIFLQALGGVRDGSQSTLDLAWDISPVNVLVHGGLPDETNNPIQLPEVSPPETIPGALSRGVAQFLVGFIPASKLAKVIKPIARMGNVARGAIAGGVTDFTVFGPHEERLSNLIESFSSLSNPVTSFLQADPDDSAAMGRFKNALEGVLVGSLLEPFAQSLRMLKYAKVMRLIRDVKSKTHYKLEVQKIENEFLELKNIQEGDSFRGLLKNKEYIFEDLKLEKIDYVKRSKADNDSLRKIFDRNVRKDFLKDLAKDEELLKNYGFSDDDIAGLKKGHPPEGWQVHHNLPLDDSGTNDFSNLVLIKNDPYHKVITNYQKAVTKGMTVGDVKNIDWPVIKSNIYPLIK